MFGAVEAEQLLGDAIPDRAGADALQHQADALRDDEPGVQQRGAHQVVTQHFGAVRPKRLTTRCSDAYVRMPTSQLLAISLLLRALRHRMLADMSETSWGVPDMSELPSGLPIGTVTLLLADVEGSTRLWETQPDTIRAAVARLDQPLSHTVAAHHGVRPVEQGEGDSFVIAFARAADSVACALDLQRAPLAPIKLRIGLRDLPRPERVVQLRHPDLHNDFPPLRTANAVAAERIPVQVTSLIGRPGGNEGHPRSTRRKPVGHR